MSLISVFVLSSVLDIAAFLRALFVLRSVLRLANGFLTLAGRRLRTNVFCLMRNDLSESLRTGLILLLAHIIRPRILNRDCPSEHLGTCLSNPRANISAASNSTGRMVRELRVHGNHILDLHFLSQKNFSVLLFITTCNGFHILPLHEEHVTIFPFSSDIPLRHPQSQKNLPDVLALILFIFFQILWSQRVHLTNSPLARHSFEQKCFLYSLIALETLNTFLPHLSHGIIFPEGVLMAIL